MDKKIPNLIKAGLIIFIVFSFFTLFPAQIRADISDPLTFTPQVGLPGLVDKGQQITLTNGDTSYLAQMVKGFYNYGLGIAGILAAIVLMAGGILWLTSAGSSDKISQAKGLIMGSITGLLLVFSSWLILKTINPYLLNFKIQTINNIEKMMLGCCQYTNKAEITNNKKCEAGGGQFLTKVSDKFQGDRYYSLDNNGKRCSLPGCCVSKAGNGEVISCANTMSYNCNSTTFYYDSCIYVSSLFGGCPQTDICQKKDTENGDECFEKNGYGICHCYNGIAWYNNQGQKGEPCGDHGNSTCTTEGGFDYTGVYCTGSNMWHDMNGRSCGTDLYCCYEE